MLIYLLAHPEKKPYFLEPRPDIREAKERLVTMRTALEKMTVEHIKQNVLPLFITDFEKAEAFRKAIKYDAKDKVVQKVWDLIMADP